MSSKSTGGGNHKNTILVGVSPRLTKELAVGPPWAWQRGKAWSHLPEPKMNLKLSHGGGGAAVPRSSPPGQSLVWGEVGPGFASPV